MPASRIACLASDLVPAADAGRRARAGVGHADELEQLLHRAVLAVAPVQRDEGDVRPRRRAGARRGRGPTSIEIDVVAEALERVLDARARAQRDLALERAAALQHRDAAHRSPRPARAQSCTSRRPVASRRRTARGGRAGRPRRAGVAARSASSTARPARARPCRCAGRPRGCRPRPRRRSSAASRSRRGRRGTRRGRARTRRSRAARGPAGRSCRCSRAAWPR